MLDQLAAEGVGERPDVALDGDVEVGAGLPAEQVADRPADQVGIDALGGGAQLRDAGQRVEPFGQQRGVD